MSGATALTSLHCRGNQLTSLDVGKNTALYVLVCYGNQLTSLDLRRNTVLASVGLFSSDHSKNSLTELKIHESQAGQGWVVGAKLERGDKLTISTYATDPGAPDGFKLVCADYDPINKTCLQAAP